MIAAGYDVRFIDSASMSGRVRALRRLVTEPIDLVHTQLFEANVTGRLATIGLEVPVLTCLVNTDYAAVRRRIPTSPGTSSSWPGWSIGGRGDCSPTTFMRSHTR